MKIVIFIEMLKKNMVAGVIGFSFKGVYMRFSETVGSEGLMFHFPHI